jgi:xylan 1,4-beta-xylosidase
MWLTETNSAVNSACLAQDKCSTTFPGPMGMGASFNRSLWRAKGSVLGTEMRALNNLGWHRDAGSAAKAFIALTGFGPNINIARDPRFGRSSELPGEGE